MRNESEKERDLKEFHERLKDIHDRLKKQIPVMYKDSMTKDEIKGLLKELNLMVASMWGNCNKVSMIDNMCDRYAEGSYRIVDDFTYGEQLIEIIRKTNEAIESGSADEVNYFTDHAPLWAMVRDN